MARTCLTTTKGLLDPKNLLLPTLKRSPWVFKSKDYFYALLRTLRLDEMSKEPIFKQLREMM